MKGIIIMGSAQSNGNTFKIISRLNQKLDYSILDLNTKTIHEFDYEFKNREDDFLPTMRDIVENYDLILFASPIYWYSMSGRMKTFFDRISDCLKIEKETGRKLRGMKMAVLACGSDDNMIDAFFAPFRASADYLGMEYLGEIHTWLIGNDISQEVDQRLHDFAEDLISVKA